MDHAAVGNNQTAFPVSFGKPSLRRRLEAFYSLVAPATIENREEWLCRYDKIYEKYGGSYDKEMKLSDKLAKKYGDQVRLLVAGKSSEVTSTENEDNISHEEIEKTYILSSEELQSTCIDFTSSSFNPIAALRSKVDPVTIIPDKTAPLLDNISKARMLLPEGDPLRLLPRKRAKLESNAFDKAKAKRCVFDMIAENIRNGPFSLLWKCMTTKKRVRVLIRHANCVRGTLSGYVKAFDKHFNLILTDADEYFTSRMRNTSTLSNAEKELKRRRLDLEERRFGNRLSLSAKMRNLKQILVRGDNIISLWAVDNEKFNPGCTIGTPGSISNTLSTLENG